MPTLSSSEVLEALDHYHVISVMSINRRFSKVKKIIQLASMAHRVNLFPAFLLLLAAAFSAFAVADDVDCVYSIFIRTGSIFKAGTDSKVSVRLYDTKGWYLEIRDLESWGGLMGEGYNYFERTNLDIFGGRAPCLPAPVCGLNLTSDGSGPHHGWYVNYVEVNVAGVHAQCTSRQFEIEQWLALDASPYELTAIRNFCPKDTDKIRSSRVGSGVREALFSIV